MAADWSQLPYEIVVQVVEKFKSPEDIITFSMICCEWEDFSTQVKTNWTAEIPWIMLSEAGEDISKIAKYIGLEKEEINLIVNNKHPHIENEACIRRFFDPLNSKVYHLKLPELCSRKCFCSPFGWLLTIGLDLEVKLFNPLTKSCLGLPSVWTTPEVSTLTDYQRIWMRTMHVEKGIVLKLPNENGTFFVMIVECHLGSLAFSRPGDRLWIPVMTTKVVDVVYWNNVFLILHQQGDMSYFHYSDSLRSDASVAIVPEVYKYSPQQQVKDLRRRRDLRALFRLYLLVARDDLYLICRNRIDFDVDVEDDDGYRTLSFTSFVFNKNNRKWDEADIGDMAIFVGNGSNIHANLVPLDTKWEPNSISFMDDCSDLYSYPKREGGGHDTGVYNLKSKNMRYMNLGVGMHSRFCVPLFFVPTLV